MPRRTSQTQGTCLLCSAPFKKTAMKKHLQTCLEKNMEQGLKEGQFVSQKIFLIQVEGYGLSGDNYWIYLAALGNASLTNLDTLLRGLWVECCGHLSAFYIGKQELGKSKKLEHFLTPGDKFVYEYDFGTTTELKLTVMGVMEGFLKKGKVQVLARNDAPFIQCSHCDKPATEICTECIYDGQGWLCNECARKHKCDEDRRLPLVNSPRTGVCGYTG